MKRIYLIGLFCCVWVGCSGLDVPTQGQTQSQLHPTDCAPKTNEGDALPTSWFSIGKVDEMDDANQVFLLKGDLSSDMFERVARGEIIASVEGDKIESEKLISGGTLWLAPHFQLEAGQVVTAVHATLGVKKTFRVVDNELPLGRVLWPTQRGQLVDRLVVCTDSTIDTTAGPLLAMSLFEPIGDSGFSSGAYTSIAGTNCYEFTRECRAAFRVVEPACSSENELRVLIDPELSGPSEQPPEAECQPPFIAAKQLCIEVQDDRIVLRTRAEKLLVRQQKNSDVFFLSFGHSMTLRGFDANKPFTADVEISAAAESWKLRLEGSMAPARPHVVLNEILANSEGPEPSSEWIELYNDSDDDVVMNGWVIEDAGGQTELPLTTLQGHRFALVVAKDAPVSATRFFADDSIVMTVDRVGKSGLANTGEALRLYDDKRRLVSSFPSVAAKQGGQSVSRRNYDVNDDEIEGFLPSTATPGAANEVSVLKTNE